MITFTLIVVGVLFVGGVVAILHAARHAPEGYEDELGFHPRLRHLPATVQVDETTGSSGHNWIAHPLARPMGTRAPHGPVGAF